MNILVKFNQENKKEKFTRYYYDIKEIEYNFSTITLISKYDRIIINPCKVYKMTIEKGEDYND